MEQSVTKGLLVGREPLAMRELWLWVTKRLLEIKEQFTMRGQYLESKCKGGCQEVI